MFIYYNTKCKSFNRVIICYGKYSLNVGTQTFPISYIQEPTTCLASPNYNAGGAYAATYYPYTISNTGFKWTVHNDANQKFSWVSVGY